MESSRGSASTPSEADVAASIETALATLRNGGNRITDARRAVIEMLARHGDHPTADQLGESIHLAFPSVHRATVYRTLETLTALGIATHVHVSGGATAYHLAADGGGRSHLHASCRSCGRIVDLPADLLDPITRRLAEDGEFELDPTHLALSGTCWECREKAF